VPRCCFLRSVGLQSPCLKFALPSSNPARRKTDKPAAGYETAGQEERTHERPGRVQYSTCTRRPHAKTPRLQQVKNKLSEGHGRPQAWARGAWKCCKVFLYTLFSSYSKRLGIPIIYALFSQPVVGFWGSIPGLLVCPPLEKSLRAPMLTDY